MCKSTIGKAVSVLHCHIITADRLCVLVTTLSSIRLGNLGKHV